MAQTGAIPARRCGRQWRIDRNSLTGSVEEAATARRQTITLLQEGLNDSLESIKPPKRAPAERGFYSVRDLDAFRIAAEVLQERTALESTPQTSSREVSMHLERFLSMLTDGFHQFHPQVKVDRLVAARSELCAAIAGLAREGLHGERTCAASMLDRLERDVLRSLRGLIRLAERRKS